jgi:hypothetical protein
VERVRRRDEGGDRVIDGYLRGLERELAERGVRGAFARRVLAEARDHLVELEEKHGTIEPFGTSGQVAREIAAQLATTRTIRSTYGAFGALAVVGLAYLAFIGLVGREGSPDLFGARHELIGVAATLGLALFPQIAFVSGCLALLRALRLRRAGTLSSEELDVIRGRGTVALGAAGLAAVSMAVWSLEFRVDAELLALAAVSFFALGVAASAVIRAGRPRAVAAGAAGDLFDDLGFRMDPWRFALLFASAIALLGLAGGWVAEGDPGSGLVRGAFEGVAVLACFAALGRRLALRR